MNGQSSTVKHGSQIIKALLIKTHTQAPKVPSPAALRTPKIKKTPTGSLSGASSFAPSLLLSPPLFSPSLSSIRNSYLYIHLRSGPVLAVLVSRIVLIFIHSFIHTDTHTDTHRHTSRLRKRMTAQSIQEMYTSHPAGRACGQSSRRGFFVRCVLDCAEHEIHEHEPTSCVASCEQCEHVREQSCSR